MDTIHREEHNAINNCQLFRRMIGWGSWWRGGWSSYHSQYTCSQNYGIIVLTLVTQVAAVSHAKGNKFPLVADPDRVGYVPQCSTSRHALGTFDKVVSFVHIFMFSRPAFDCSCKEFCRCLSVVIGNIYTMTTNHDHETCTVQYTVQQLKYRRSTVVGCRLHNTKTWCLQEESRYTRGVYVKGRSNYSTVYCMCCIVQSSSSSSIVFQPSVGVSLRYYYSTGPSSSCLFASYSTTVQLRDYYNQ